MKITSIGRVCDVARERGGSELDWALNFDSLKFNDLATQAQACK